VIRLTDKSRRTGWEIAKGPGGRRRNNRNSYQGKRGSLCWRRKGKKLRRKKSALIELQIHIKGEKKAGRKWGADDGGNPGF